MPTYREADNLRPLCEAAHAAMTAHEIPYELIIADDRSPDDTEAVARALAERYPLRLILAEGRPRDLSLSVLDGIAAAAGRYIVVMDADLSHPVDRIPDMLCAVREESGVFALGSRYAGGGGFDRRWSIWRLINSKAATLLARPLVKAADPLSGFFAARRKDLRAIGDYRPIGYKIALELMVRTRFRKIVEVPILFRDRTIGESKMNLREMVKYLRHLRRLYVYKFGTLGEFLNFLAVGGSGFVVDICFYYLLQFLGLDHRLARAIAFWPATTWNWALNRITSFGDRKRLPRRRQWTEYVISSGFAFVVSWGMYASLTSWSPWFEARKLLALIIGIGLASVINFTVSTLFVFGERRR